MVMRQGQCIMFWSTLMHASHPHEGRTDKMRLGFTARYVPTSVRVYPYQDALEEYGVSVSLDKFGSVLVAGEDRFGHNRIIDRTLNGTPFVTQ
jgi:non-heme Fe2+,alpha-ketoglutarate-dependent halogenase